jgi:pimeloyl-ACP methyl ester carboxylesterase
MGTAKSLPLDNHALNSLRRSSSQTNLKDKTVVEYPPLVVVKDSSCQTTVTYPVRQESWLNNKIVKLCAFTVVGLLTSFVLLALFSRTCQSMFIYMNILNYPIGDLTNLNRFGLHDARNIRIETSDGLRLRGWHLLPPGDVAAHSARLAEGPDRELFFNSHLRNASTVVIYFHGNAGNRALPRRVSIVRRLSSQLAAHVLALDYRGFGDSEGWPSEQGTALDSQALWAWLEGVVCGGNVCGQEGFPPRVFLYGHSLGSAIASQLAADISLHQQQQARERMRRMASECVSAEESEKRRETTSAMERINSSTGSGECSVEVGAGSSQGMGLRVSGLVLDSAFSSVAEAVTDFPYAAPLRLIPFLVPFM